MGGGEKKRRGDSPPPRRTRPGTREKVDESETFDISDTDCMLGWLNSGTFLSRFFSERLLRPPPPPPHPRPIFDINALRLDRSFCGTSRWKIILTAIEMSFGNREDSRGLFYEECKDSQKD